VLENKQTPKKNKRTPVFVIAGVAAFLAIVAVTSMTGEVVEDRVADAQVENEQLRAELTVLQEQMNATIVVLSAHETVLQQHDLQIRNIANTTNIIGSWAGEFSANINDRVTVLEGE
jgi:D-ribose pyranose/furanose isomerase RbsD